MDKYWGDWNKKHKKQPFGDASASHLSLVLWHVWFQAEAWISHTTSPTPPSYEVGGIAKRIKTTRLQRKTKPGRDMILHVRPEYGIILNINHLSRTRSIASLPCKIVYKEIFLSSGFFAVKRRAVFILGAMWWALVRGWRRDCVVGGMETRFQWRKAHNPYAKCEAFHIAPRLFFMFLFFIPLTIRQQCIIYPHKFSSEPKYGVICF